MPNVVDQSTWWNPLLTSAILVAYMTNVYNIGGLYDKCIHTSQKVSKKIYLMSSVISQIIVRDGLGKLYDVF